MIKKIIEVNRLGKTYGKGEATFDALAGVSLHIYKGEVVAIVGKSGSGKSTLLHLMALLDTPSTGSIKINSSNVTGLSRSEIDNIRNDKFGFVFQQFFLNANETALNNVILPLKIAGVPAAERLVRGMEVLKAVDLESKSDNKANDLSGGQKQRVAIARALINNPSVIFADEPTGNLDTNTGEKIEELLFSLNQKLGITLIFVTHDQDLAKRCNRIIRIQDGKIVNESKKR